MESQLSLFIPDLSSMEGRKNYFLLRNSLSKSILAFEKILKLWWQTKRLYTLCVVIQPGFNEKLAKFSMKLLCLSLEKSHIRRFFFWDLKAFNGFTFLTCGVFPCKGWISPEFFAVTKQWCFKTLRNRDFPLLFPPVNKCPTRVS